MSNRRDGRRLVPGSRFLVPRTKNQEQRTIGRHAFPIVLSSPSGAGKTSIARGVIVRDARVKYSVSATTRPMREGEKQGRDYFFYTPRQFAVLKKTGQLLETAEVYGYDYGTPKRPILEALKKGYDVIADLDIQGARSLRKLVPDTVTVFITAPDSRDFQRRLHNRKTDAPDVIRRRLECARQELAALPEFGYVVVNRSLDQAIEDVLTIIRAERLRNRGRTDRS